MVERRLEIEDEVKEMLQYIENKQNFILTGGAGSGKTYSLISLIQEIGRMYPNKSIVCITYTNNAVAEIKSRISNDKLFVSTIHEFLWKIIKKYQKELKETIIELIYSEEEKYKKFTLPKDNLEKNKMKINLEYFLNSEIVYDEYYSLKSEEDSKIGHDEVLLIAEKMFEKYSKLCDILKDNANFIFIDEYQDTSEEVANIFLNHINNSKKENIIGFFGDSMQSIYDSGIGNIKDDSLKRINKIQNRRSSLKVIELTNKLRDDGIKQIPSKNTKETNIDEKTGKIKEGNVKFIYSNNNILEELKKTYIFNDWDFKNTLNTKELRLTHKLNAENSGFKELYNLYTNDFIYSKLISKLKEKKISEDEDINNFGYIIEKFPIFSGKGKIKKNILEQVDMKSKKEIEKIKDIEWGKIKNSFINKDSLLGYKFNGLTEKYESTSNRDKILQKLDLIYESINLYNENKYVELFKKLKIKISSYEDKIKIRKEMNELIELMKSQNDKIYQIIDKANNILNIKNDERYIEFIENKGWYLWNRIKDISFSEYVKSIEYQKEYFPYSTQHSVKGSEFDNVLVILDNGKWSKYNFNLLLENIFDENNILDKTKKDIFNRTKKLFYVCCTRAKENLIVFIQINNQKINKEKIISNAKELFGEENVINGDELINNI
ncbi:UvrD/REP helicase [Leptotrichia wadei]|uniref:UvrD/REP helicase n=1 Tax=Leptotrichia wadei TaxID=157687 RepID=A0A7U6LBT7_9FUSO|nr:UvrD-helicase domain-containing protein [Leptotrichia wadei]BBM43520.1 UvrD/REP helicase [Leptotrichia wadei]